MIPKALRRQVRLGSMHFPSIHAATLGAVPLALPEARAALDHV